MLSIICLIFASIFKALIDVLNSRFNVSVFNKIKNEKLRNWFNPTISWKNKYKDGDSKKGPKFFLSTTVFVMFTDGWHLFNSGMIFSFILALTLNAYYVPFFSIIIDTILYHILYGIVFQPLYSKFLIKK
jgi:hypothetical protein